MRAVRRRVKTMHLPLPSEILEKKLELKTKENVPNINNKIKNILTIKYSRPCYISGG
jgi:hypothetical protein